MGNTIDDRATTGAARVSRRGVLAAGALGVAAGLAAAMRVSAQTVPTVNRTSEEETMTTLDTARTEATPSLSAVTDGAIRPFTVAVPDEALDVLRRRIAAARWPEAEPVADQSQGVQLATVQEVARYWQTEYDWRACEARLNALPQFLTEIDGLDIHFIHVRSKHEDALPLIVTHGWPGSVIEQLKIIGPLTDPTAHGGSAEDAFHLVIPSMPGYGFSGKPAATGWNTDRIARAWVVLMQRLGYARYVAHGGDWGSPISGAMARQAPEGLLGIHVTLPEVVPLDVLVRIRSGAPAPAELSDAEKRAYDQVKMATTGGGYIAIQGRRPQTVGYGLADSPVLLAAWLLDHDPRSYEQLSQLFVAGHPFGDITRDDVLDNISLYWFTNTGTSAARLYWEGNGSIAATDISLPAAITVFPGEIYQTPRSWAEKAYHNLIHFNEVDRGGHYAAWEQPQLLSEELRAAFRSLR